MSRRIIRLSKLSSRNNNAFIQKCVRFFSTGPYLTLGCNTGDVLLFDPAKEQIIVTLQGKTIPKELKDEEMIGASHGWGFFYDRRDLSVRMSDIFNPLASKSNPTVIPLPRLTDLPSEQIEQVCNVAMSSPSPLGDEDCVVAIKFSGDQLSLCRPGRDLEWTNTSTPSHCCIHFFSYHLNDENIEHHKLVYRDHPELDQSEWKTLSMCSRREYLVESPSSDERYLVKWYAQGSYSSVLNGIDYKTKRFMVFREEETAEGKFMCYTEDIGEMCIFIASNETFCIPASSCPGLKPSTIYFMGHGFGSYDLTTGDTHHYKAPGGVITTPCWIPLVSI
ncbi:BnaA08g28290D [Brassica napus]|uniref:BnaA08g28290D protein n=1 Tax=Brassica napus TaxID=3708 RepID=A0A078FMB3_BRANA|nr:BnaA08g28290D [Brassica napus]